MGEGKVVALAGFGNRALQSSCRNLLTAPAGYANIKKVGLLGESALRSLFFVGLIVEVKCHIKKLVGFSLMTLSSFSSHLS